jgi:hypothetical protein
MDTATKATVREAMLNAQSRWLENAETADHPTGRTIALVIADAFGKEATEYKVPDQARAAINVAAYDKFAEGQS